MDRPGTGRRTGGLLGTVRRNALAEAPPPGAPISESAGRFSSGRRCGKEMRKRAWDEDAEDIGVRILHSPLTWPRSIKPGGWPVPPFGKLHRPGTLGLIVPNTRSRSILARTAAAGQMRTGLTRFTQVGLTPYAGFYEIRRAGQSPGRAGGEARGLHNRQKPSQRQVYLQA